MMMYCHIGSNILEKEVASGRGVTGLFHRHTIHAEHNICKFTCKSSIALRRDAMMWSPAHKTFLDVSNACTRSVDHIYYIVYGPVEEA